jgi:agmatine deiminase
MPAETAPHERTLIAWPTEERRATLWQRQLEPARDAHAQLARAIALYEPTTMIVHPDDVIGAKERCGDRVDLLALEIDDSWIRDNGPIIVRDVDGSRSAIAFGFNAWGNKIAPYGADARAARATAEALGFPVRDVPLVLEGGSIAVDGRGTLVTTERCLLNPNRNPSRSRSQIEATLAEWLGAERIIWLTDAIAEDDGTDGHVDNVVAFLGDGRALVQGCADPDNPNAAIAADNVQRLARAGIETVLIPDLPYAEVDGRVVPVPYVNLYAGNGFVAVPVVGAATDDSACARIAECYPDRAVIRIPGGALAYGGGGIHCITQQVPA